MIWKQVIKNRPPWTALSSLKWAAQSVLAALSAHWRAPLRAFLCLKYKIHMYVFVCKLLPKGRERGRQVQPDCLVRIYWRAHVGDWCVVTWRDCTWRVGVFVSTPPTPRRGCARAATIRPMLARWRGLRYVGSGHCSWRGTWWQGIFLPPPPFRWLGRAGADHSPTWLWRGLAISKLNFNTHTLFEIIL
jgi:hypothetical protein